MKRIGILLLMLAAHAFAQSKQFKCLVTGTTPIGRNVTVVTRTTTILGTPHRVGTAEIGRASGTTFWVSWDATEPSATVGRTDADGFEASASTGEPSLIALMTKRPNEAEIRVFCSAQ